MRRRRELRLHRKETWGKLLFSRLPIWLNLLLGLGILLGLGYGIYRLPPVYDRLSWRVEVLRSQIYYFFNPPEEVVFVPGQGQSSLDAMVQGTMDALQPTPTQPTATASATAPGPTSTTTLTPTITLTPTALPDTVALGGVKHEWQKFNNCGPTTLAMGLSFWGWKGDQFDTAGWLKPNERDRNVSPYEIEAYVEQEAGMAAIVRLGGDFDVLMSLIASGYPVMVEKGFEQANVEGWQGHYSLFTGYNAREKYFISQDSFNGPDFNYSFERVGREWLAFDYVFIVIYPPEDEQTVLAILGPWADEAWADQRALDIANEQITSFEGRDLYFAYYNKGTSHVAKFEYVDAALAYDQAFVLYGDLTEAERPYRMLWYQTGPYKAYYWSGRYQDVIDLANTTLIETINEPVLEESWYWRGLAKEALGDIEGAIADLQESVRLNPNFTPGWEQLARLGASG